MDDLKIWELLVNQGISFVLLALGIWWFNKKNESQEAKIDLQQQKINSLYSEIAKIHDEDKGKLITIIERHSDALEHMTAAFERILVNNKE